LETHVIIINKVVGKSNILLQFVHNKFKTDHEITIGCEFGAKNVDTDDKTLRIQIWDTAGQETFRSITRSYYKNSCCAFLVYDITKRDSFNNITKWLEECKQNTPKTVLLVLVGNKEDLKDE
jgi:small GTP-binding protein